MYSAVWKRRDPESSGYPVSNHWALTIVTPPVAEPVTLTQLKQHARIPYDDADDILALYISAAREKVERYLRRALLTQTWDLTLDWGPAWVELPRAPLQSVTGVFATGLDNVEVTVASQVYFTNVNARLVSLNIGQVWPLHRGKAGFRIRYVAGYGDLPTVPNGVNPVPAAIRHQILTLAARHDDDREIADMPEVKAALRAFRIEGQPLRTARGVAREDLLA